MPVRRFTVVDPPTFEKFNKQLAAEWLQPDDFVIKARMESDDLSVRRDTQDEGQTFSFQILEAAPPHSSYWHVHAENTSNGCWTVFTHNLETGEITFEEVS